MGDISSLNFIKVEKWKGEGENSCFWNIAANQLEEGATDAEIAELTNQIKALNAEKNSSIIREGDVLYTEDSVLIPLEYAIDEITTNIGTKTTEISEANTTLTTAQGKLTDANNKVATALSELQSAQSSLDSPGEKGDKEKAQQAVADAQKKYTDALQEQQEALEEQQDAEKKLNAKKEELDDLETELKDIQEEYKDAEDVSQEDLEKLNEEIGKLDEEIQKAEDNLENLKEDAANETAQAQQLAAKNITTTDKDGNITMKEGVTADDIEKTAEESVGTYDKSKLEESYQGGGITKYYDKFGNEIDPSLIKDTGNKTADELRQDIIDTTALGIYQVSTNNWDEDTDKNKEGVQNHMSDRVESTKNLLNGLSYKDCQAVKTALEKTYKENGYSSIEEALKDCYGDNYAEINGLLNGNSAPDSVEYTAEDLSRIQTQIFKDSTKYHNDYNAMEELFGSMDSNEMTNFQNYYDANNTTSFNDFMDNRIDQYKENAWKSAFLRDVKVMVDYADQHQDVSNMSETEIENSTKETHFNNVDMAIQAGNVKQVKTLLGFMAQNGDYESIRYIEEQYGKRYGTMSINQGIEKICENGTNSTDYSDIMTYFTDAKRDSNKDSETDYNEDYFYYTQAQQFDTATNSNSSTISGGDDRNGGDIWGNQVYLRVLMSKSDEELIAINNAYGEDSSIRAQLDQAAETGEFNDHQLALWYNKLDRIGI